MKKIHFNFGHEPLDLILFYFFRGKVHWFLINVRNFIFVATEKNAEK